MVGQQTNRVGKSYTGENDVLPSASAAKHTAASRHRLEDVPGKAWLRACGLHVMLDRAVKLYTCKALQKIWKKQCVPRRGKIRSSTVVHEHVLRI